jgi:6-phosphogluconate dehydrogenase
MSALTENKLCDVAVIGLGVMGANLARNFASRGLRVAGYDRDPAPGQRLNAEHPEANVRVATSLPDLVASLERPRRIIMLVNAGKPVDSVIGGIDALLEKDDILVDAGNSHYTDTDRHIALSRERPWRFVGMGVSGGSEGALRGPSIMPGGDMEAWLRLKPVLEAVAARSRSGVCVTYCGKESAGHFVKMVHNGIEYGDMQLIAETALLLRRGLGMPAEAVAETFSRWNETELESFLVQLTAEIYRTPDPQNPQGLLVDAILDRAGQKGTGKWTIMAGAELGVPIPTIAAAVDARGLSSTKELRVTAERAFAPTRALLSNVLVEDLKDALYASKVASYTQGFALMKLASEQFGYGTNLAEVARIWTAGCIIRAVFLDRIQQAFSASPAPDLLALAPDFVADLAKRLPAWRRVVAAASLAGVAVPGLSASLQWFDTLTTADGSANLIQAQRDAFGSHTYERRDKPGVFVHTDWPVSAKD